MSSERVPLSAPSFGGRESRYLQECIDTGWVSPAGSFVRRFEERVAEAVGAPHAVAAASGTAALHLALDTLGVGEGDEVLVPALSFIAPANAVRYVGGEPVLIDAEPGHWQMDPGLVTRFLEHECDWRDGALLNRASGRRVRAVVVVHVLGHPVDFGPIEDAARRYGLYLIEDAAQSLGAAYHGRKVGTLGDIACLSFNANKVITAGAGGMLITENEEWAARARYLSLQAKDEPLEYRHERVGYNYGLTNLHAAIGCAQIERLDEHIAAKRRIAAAYAEAFAGTDGIDLMPEADWAFSTCWLSTILVDRDRYGMDSRALMRALNERGIECRPLWQPLHLSGALKGCQVRGGAVAERLCAAALSLPSSVDLSRKQQRAVVDAIRR